MVATCVPRTVITPLVPTSVLVLAISSSMEQTVLVRFEMATIKSMVCSQMDRQQ